MPEDFSEIQDDIDRAQDAIDATQAESDDEILDSEEYAEVILNDVDEFQTWLDGITPPDGMSQEEFDELTVPILVSLRDLLLSFDDEKNIDIYVETLSEELGMLRDEVEDLTLPSEEASEDEGHVEAVHSPAVDLADTRPPGFAELMEDSDTEAVLAQYSMQERLEILAEVSEGVELTERQMFRLENLNILVTMLESLSNTLKKDGVSKETEFLEYVLDKKVGEWASKIVENPDLTIEPVIAGYGKDGVLLSRLLLDSGWYGGIESINSEEELLDQKWRLAMWMRNRGDYEAARVVLEEALSEEFEEGRKQIEEKRPKMREEAVRTVSEMLSTEERGGENAGKSVYDIWNEEGIAQDTQEEFVKGLIDAETERLINRKVAEEFLEDDMFDGKKRGLWSQYREMIDPKGELLNFTDENAKWIMREVAINGLLILISGGVAGLVRAGVGIALSVGARILLGTARFTRIAESIGSMAKGGLMARRAYQGLRLSAGAAGLLVEGAAFDVAYMGLQGELFYKQPGWVQSILWTSATLGVFKGAGKLSAAINGKIGSAVSKYAPKIADKSLVMGIQKLVVAGHIEVAGMLLSGALQKGYFSITEEEEFEWDWSEELLHAYVAVGALKIDGGIIHAGSKSFRPQSERAVWGNSTERAAPKPATEVVLRNTELSPEARVEEASRLLGREKLSKTEKDGLLEAHEMFGPNDTKTFEQHVEELLSDSTPEQRTSFISRHESAVAREGTGAYTPEQLFLKRVKLEKSGFSRPEARSLIEYGLAGFKRFLRGVRLAVTPDAYNMGSKVVIPQRGAQGKFFKGEIMDWSGVSESGERIYKVRFLDEGNMYQSADIPESVLNQWNGKFREGQAVNTPRGRAVLTSDRGNNGIYGVKYEDGRKSEITEYELLNSNTPSQRPVERPRVPEVDRSGPQATVVGGGNRVIHLPSPENSAKHRDPLGTEILMASDKGPDSKYDHNEDRVAYNPDTGRVTVIDGMGGYGSGDKAAEIFAEEVSRRSDIGEAVGVARSRFARELRPKGPGVVFASASVRSEAGQKYLDVEYAGDVSVYVVDGRTGQIRKVTKPDTLVQAMLDAGQLKSEWEAVNHPQANVVTNTVQGSGPSTKIHRPSTPVNPGDRVVILTDGFELVKPEQIRDAVYGKDQETALRDLDFAQRGAHSDDGHFTQDNRGVAIMDIK